MEKTIKIGKTPVKLNNNIGWLRAYRSQFGSDILPSIMPLVATLLDVMGAMLDDDGSANISVASLIKAADSDKMLDAVVHASTFEAVEIVNITWALAKCANDEIDDPETWEKQFDVFPLDTVVPAIWKLVIEGLVSSKNLKRLDDLKKKLQPITETNK